MTDEQSRQHGRLDEAIDRTVQALMRGDAPPSIRHRVLARLAGDQSTRPAAAVAWPLRRRLALGVAAGAVVLGSALVATRWWDRFTASPLRTTVQSMPKYEAPSSPVAAGVTGATTGQASRSAQTAAVGRRWRGGTRAAGAVTWSEATGRSPLIDPLPAPDPIAINALETERVTTEGVDIAPMVLEPLRIEAIHGQR